MSDLEQAWRSWRALSRPDRSKFLTMLRAAYAREREAAMRKRGNVAHGREALGLPELTLTEEDLRRL